MRRSGALLLLLGLTAALARPVAAQTVAADVARADSLLMAEQVESALGLLEARLAAAPDDFEARWRAARAAVWLGVLATGTELENRWYRRGVEHAARAIAARPDDPSALQWVVAAEGSLAVQTGAGEASELARSVRVRAEHLLALEPDHAGAEYALAKLQYEALKLNRAKRVIARIVGRGHELELATWDNAARRARRAVALDPAEPLFRIGLADILWRMGEREESVAQLEAAVALPHRVAIDKDRRGQAGLQLRHIREGRDP